MGSSGKSKCPTCEAPAAVGEKWFPFCSVRCQLVDLGKWLDEEYRVPEGPEASGYRLQASGQDPEPEA